MQPGGGSRDGGAWPAPRPGGVYRGLRQHLGAALAAGTMRGRSSLTFVFLSLAVTWAVAQHAPPVGELAQRARRGGGGRRCGRGREGGAVRTPGPGSIFTGVRGFLRAGVHTPRGIDSAQLEPFREILISAEWL